MNTEFQLIYTIEFNVFSPRVVHSLIAQKKTELLILIQNTHI